MKQEETGTTTIKEKYREGMGNNPSLLSIHYTLTIEPMYMQNLAWIFQTFIKE